MQRIISVCLGSTLLCKITRLCVAPDMYLLNKLCVDRSLPRGNFMVHEQMHSMPFLTD